MSKDIFHSATYDERNLMTYFYFEDYDTWTWGSNSYRYNADGQRYWKKDYWDSSAEYYLLDGAVTLGVFSPNGSLDWNIITPWGEVIGRRTSTNQWRYYAKDHLGSTRAVVTSTGSIVEVRDYYPYGLLTPGRSWVSGTAAKQGFTGHELDSESGLIYAGARYYIPNIGRWTGVDPLADKYPGWSPYNYVLNNPLRFVDPDGKEVAVYARTPAFRLALAIFASTDIGYAFLTRFATAGQAVAGRYFPSDGVWSQYRLEIRERTEPMAPRGRTRYGYFQQSRGTMQFVQGSVVGPQTVRPGARPGVRMEIMPRILEEMVLTLGHEAFLHILESFALLVSLIEDAESWEDIQKAFAEQREQSGPRGEHHHEAYSRKEGGYGNFESYYQQLKNHWLKLEMPLLKEAREEHDRRLRGE